MVRTIYSTDTCRNKLVQYASKDYFVIGLILGQYTDEREHVIHLTRTPDEKAELPENAISSSSIKSDISMLEVSEAWIADHAKHVTRMLPGGMFVQGIFITSDFEIFEDTKILNKVKSILNFMYKALCINPHMYANCPSTNERLVLHMSTKTKLLVCKSLEVGTNEPVVVKPVDWKFMAKPQVWQKMECYYEFDEMFPVIVKKNGISVKQQFQQILEMADKTIRNSVLFIDGEMRNETETLDSMTKQRKTKHGNPKSQLQEPKPMHVSLFTPFENSMPEVVEYLECDGSIHFSGIVASNVFIYPEATVKEAKEAVKQDIVRSLASRFTMHCDALIDDNLLPEEKVCFNEPPRRVLVPIDNMYLCDYLFPGEAPAEALLSVKELLDLKISEEEVICDVETPADTSEFDALDRDSNSEELATPQEASQFMYITGICFALLVLVVSIIVHYYQDIVAVVNKVIRKFQ